MECLHPITINNPRYGKLIRGSRGKPEPKYIEVPCGKCVACLSKRRQEWCFRLKQEQKASLTSWFVTLTYDDEHLPTLQQAKEYNNSLRLSVRKSGNDQIMEHFQKWHVQKFMKLLRDKYKSYVPDPYKIRYFCVSDYGGKFGRLHYHLLLFNFPLSAASATRLAISECIQKIWKKGGVYVGTVTDKSINYTCKYVLQRPSVTGCPKTWMTCSNKPGIGASFITEKNMFNVIRLKKPAVRVGDSCYMKLPRYYVYKFLPYDVPCFDNIRYDYGEAVKRQVQAKIEENLRKYREKYDED